jgi:hypothetical protein
MSVLGEVLGELDNLDGDVLGAVQQAVAKAVTKRGGGAMVALNKPSWRHGEMAPGVNLPQSGQVPLPLTPLTASGIFSSAATSITFEGRLQKPYQAERLMASVSRINTGGSVGSIQVLAQIFVGTDLNQAQLQGVNVELLGAANAFDTRMRLLQAPPGVAISLICNLFGGTPTGTDVLATSMFFLGEVIH